MSTPNKTEVDIICDELKCKDVQVKNIYHFFSSLDTKGLGERVVEKIYDSEEDKSIFKVKIFKINFVEFYSIHK